MHDAHPAEPRAHAEAASHVPRRVGRPLHIRLRTGREHAEHQLLRRHPAMAMATRASSRQVLWTVIPRTYSWRSGGGLVVGLVGQSTHELGQIAAGELPLEWIGGLL